MDKKKPDPADCECRVKYVIDNAEVEFIKNLQRKIGKKIPKGEKLAVISLDGGQIINKCQFLYSWGFDHYCAHPEVIERALKKQKAR